ncbi:MAG: hypothetical protein KDK40_04855, partial [Chlamydiia bacterium]|nr:hypothetical protein [Chlamydiia bacterium]
ADPHSENAVRPILRAAQTLQTEIDGALKELSQLVNRWDDGRRLEWLSRVGILQALLFQQPASSGAISQLSAADFPAHFAAAKELLDYQKQLAHPAHFADLLFDGSQSPVDEVYAQWK